MPTSFERRLLRVIDHIHADPAADLSLDALADVAAMSRFHWHRVFHAMTGETAAEAVRRIRMDRAARWLITEDWPVAEVARKVGYPNVRSFARTFAEAQGMTPAAFRKRGEIASPFHLRRRGETLMFDVRLRTDPARHVAGLPHRGPYMEIGKTFERVGGIVAARNLFPQITEMVGVYYDDPAAVPAEKLRSHAGFALKPGTAVPEGLEAVDLPAGRLAVIRFRGHYSGFRAAYDHLYGTWLPASGEEPRDAPAMEIYLNTPMDAAPEDLLTDICLPIR